MMSLMGSNTAMARMAVRFKCSRRAHSSRLKSMMFSRLAMPTRSQKVRMDSGVNPRRRNPLMVGIRGSSQPSTCPSSTRRSSLRLDMMVWSRLSRANSICRLGKMPSCSMNHAYNGRCTSNSNVHRLCVMFSMESL